MKIMKIVIAVLIVAVLILLVVFAVKGGFKKTDSDQLSLAGKLKNKILAKDDSFDMREFWSNGKCQGEGMVKFGTLPMKPEDFSSYFPYGLMEDAHVTPIDHGYFLPINRNSLRDAYEVRAIGDGNIVQITTKEKNFNDINHNAPMETVYKIDIEHNCTVYSYLDLLSSLSPEIKEKFDKAGGSGFFGRIPVKEGQLVGRIGGLTLDFAIFNNEVWLDFVNRDSYKGIEKWKIHTDDPFKYFTGQAKEILAARNIRKTKPISGKIDYDVDGRLIGNWFKEGSNGFLGLDRDRDWDGHLAFAYDFVYTDQIRFSIGDFNGKAAQFGIRGNSPDPAVVDKKTGLVKYELVSYSLKDKISGISWSSTNISGNPINRDEIMGTVLVQLVEDRKLKLEVFPKLTAEQVNGFTNNARIYER